MYGQEIAERGQEKALKQVVNRKYYELCLGWNRRAQYGPGQHLCVWRRFAVIASAAADIATDCCHGDPAVWNIRRDHNPDAHTLNL